MQISVFYITQNNTLDIVTFGGGQWSTLLDAFTLTCDFENNITTKASSRSLAVTEVPSSSPPEFYLFCETDNNNTVLALQAKWNPGHSFWDWTNASASLLNLGVMDSNKIFSASFASMYDGTEVSAIFTGIENTTQPGPLSASFGSGGPSATDISQNEPDHLRRLAGSY